jgi:hypothetical protein
MGNLYAPFGCVMKELCMFKFMGHNLFQNWEWIPKASRLLWLQCSPLKVTIKYNTGKKMVVFPEFKLWANLMDLN